MALRVRDAQRSDAAWLASCGAAMALETEQRTLDAATVHAGVLAAFDDPSRARYFVAMRDVGVSGAETIGSAVGTLMLTTEWSDWRNAQWWWIQSVYVMPDARRQGVFAALYRHVQQLARHVPGVAGLRLYVEGDNVAAQQTYAALGMRDAGYRIYEQALDQQAAD